MRDALADVLGRYSSIALFAFVVVAFSIIVQGLTMPPLIGWLGLRQEEDQGTSTVSTGTSDVSGQSKV